ncbi:MAG: electron transfer flavoprotein-ubiquinone oxidoreductase [Nitrospirota bacterium]|jgi:electron-transferring-flavoprotein dehydrogenase
MTATAGERLDTPVLIVGAGPAGLACALRLAQLAAAGNAGTLSPEDIYVIDKADAPGMHNLSGAVFDPIALAELVPDYVEQGFPFETPVSGERLLFLTERRAWRLPLAERLFGNAGCQLVSLGKVVQWLAEQAEAAGVNVLAGFGGASLLAEEGRVTGVLTVGQGRNRDGTPGPQFEPGAELRARVTVLAEGAHGSLTQQLREDFHLAGDNPQVYALGLKELWDVPSERMQAGTVWHSLGYPLDRSMYGGGWIYALREDRLSLGLVVGLHYPDAAFDPHAALQRYKQHPELSRLLAGGRLLRYGAKVLPAGGLWAIPRTGVPGVIAVGDGAGYLNMRRMKGIHLAMKTGMLAAEASAAVFAGAVEVADLHSDFTRRIRGSWVWPEMWMARNYHQAFADGLVRGLAHAALQLVTRGRGMHVRYPDRPGHERLIPNRTGTPRALVVDEEITFSRETSVLHSGTRHDEEQPAHLQIAEPAICHDRCTKEFGNPCTRFCPAGVYEWLDDSAGPHTKINAPNCLHCKTCEIMDPYRNIRWTVPENGGPRYEAM